MYGSRSAIHFGVGKSGRAMGVNRSVSQIHALLYTSKQPLAAEDIADALGIARSNVSNSLRELQTWNLIRPVPVLGDRRTFYQAETDLWTLVSRIAAGRKARELDPAAAALRQCVENVSGRQGCGSGRAASAERNARLRRTHQSMVRPDDCAASINDCYAHEIGGRNRALARPRSKKESGFLVNG